MTCKRVHVRGHYRCFCNGKLAKDGRCNMGKKKRASRRSASKAASCAPGTLKRKRMGKAGMRCTCRTRKGGMKIVKSSRCK